MKCHDDMSLSGLEYGRYYGFCSPHLSVPLSFLFLSCHSLGESQLPGCDDGQAALWKGPFVEELRHSVNSQKETETPDQQPCEGGSHHGTGFPNLSETFR